MKSFTYSLVLNGGSQFRTFYSYSFAAVDNTSSETAASRGPSAVAELLVGSELKFLLHYFTQNLPNSDTFQALVYVHQLFRGNRFTFCGNRGRRTAEINLYLVINLIPAQSAQRVLKLFQIQLEALGQCIPPPRHCRDISPAVFRIGSRSPPKFNRLFIGPLPTFRENFMQIRSEVFAQSC